MLKNLFSALFIVIFITASGQFIKPQGRNPKDASQKKRTPATLSEAIKILDSDCPESLKQKIRQTPDKDLRELGYPWGGDYKTVSEWTDKESNSKISKHLSDKGVVAHQDIVIFLAFKNHLLGLHSDENTLLKPYQEIEKKWKEEDKVRYTTDSLRGVYIPKGLEDCFKQIDGFWDDSTKLKIKQQTEDEFTGGAHFGFGMWMRNNWRLWGGSRLSKYFNEKGIFHPDDISGIILVSYHRYLTGKDIQLQQQIDYYTTYWKVNEDPSQEIYPEGEREMEFNTKQMYALKDGNIPGCVHIQSNSKTNNVWIYDYHFGWKQLSREELKRLESTTAENREDTLRELFKERQ